MYDEVAFFLYALVKWYKPDLIIQTGHLWGKSASVVLDALNDGFLTGGSSIEETPQNADKIFTGFVTSNRPLINSPVFISVDPICEGVPNPATAVAHLKQKHANFEFFCTDSSSFFKAQGDRLRQQYAGKRILVIVDGDHSLDGCLYDLDNAARLNAGMIFLDDIRWLPYIGRVAKSFAWKRGYGRLELPLYNGIALLVRESTSQPTSPRVSRSALRNLVDSLALLSYRLVHRRAAAGILRIARIIHSLSI